MTILEALRSLTNYPFGDNLLSAIAIQRGLILTEDFTKEAAESNSFIGAKADCYKELALGINVSQGGISFSISDKDRIIAIANELYSTIGETLIGEVNGPTVTLIE